MKNSFICLISGWWLFLIGFFIKQYQILSVIFLSSGILLFIASLFFSFKEGLELVKKIKGCLEDEY